MNLATILSQNRRKTAIVRTDYSRPIRIALTDGLIDPTTTVFDYGCGLGDDVRHLGLRGIPSWGWDPEHRREGVPAAARIVNLGYVVNVIEDVNERVECLKRAWSFAQRTLIVSARLATDTADLKPAGAYGDGVVTSIGTFQKFYEQGEFKDWLDEHLPEPAVPAGPGVFYVFREATDRIGFLASPIPASRERSPAVGRARHRRAQGPAPAADRVLRTTGPSAGRRRVARQRGDPGAIRQRASRTATDRKGTRSEGVEGNRAESGPGPAAVPCARALRRQDALWTAPDGGAQGRQESLLDVPQRMRASRRGTAGSRRHGQGAEGGTAITGGQGDSVGHLRARERPGQPPSPAEALRGMRPALHRSGRRGEPRQAPHHRTHDLLPVVSRVRVRFRIPLLHIP